MMTKKFNSSLLPHHRLRAYGVAAEQVLRAGVLKQLCGFSYEELAFHLADSSSYQTFGRLGYHQKPLTKPTLQRSIKRVKPGTWEAINQMPVHKAQQLGIESGDRTRTDCTVVESNIRHPTDSSLLWNCVRVLTRLMGVAKEEFGLEFHDHSRRARRRWASTAPRPNPSASRCTAT
jgi:IS5 family transposase